MKTMKKMMTLLAVAGLVLALAPAAQAADVTIDRVLVGNTGNTGEAIVAGGNLGTRDFGAVSYEYYIGTYEVTNDQYAEFLNAVGKSANVMYNTNMNSNARGGITQSGSSPNFTYAVKTNMGDKPVNFVFPTDAARFANWMHNGQPTTGVQDDTTTEDGVYDMPSTTLNYTSPFTRKAGWQWALANLDEWHKAAYHKNDGDTGNYWIYPTGSDTAPTAVTANGTGDGSAGATGNNANFNNVADWNGQDGNVTTFGSNGGPSPYGTFDQGGNVWEWNEEMYDSTKQSMRGGSYSSASANLGHLFVGNTKSEGAGYGFRVVSSVAPPGPPAGTVLVIK